MYDRMSDQPPNSLLRNIGQFVGHIAHAVKTDPDAPPPSSISPSASAQPVAARTTVQEQATPDGTLILRRTTIDEIVRKEPDGSGDGQ